MAVRADRDQQGFSGGTSSSDNPGGSANRDASGQTRQTPTVGVKGPASRENAPVTSWGAPIHTVDDGTIFSGIKVARAPAQWSVLNQQVKAYNTAATRWNVSASKPSFANLINNLAPMGFRMEAPQFNKPKTYSGGDYHLGVNPAAAIGSLASFAIPGLGTPAAALLGAGYTAAGFDDVMLGGPAVPAGWRVWGGPGGSAAKRGGSSPGRGTNVLGA